MLGGYLASITSYSENDFLYATFKDPAFFPEAWIGYSDDNSANTWEWVSGEESSFTYWHPNQPSNSFLDDIETEDYAVINLRSDDPYGFSEGRWNDLTINGFIYQYLRTEGQGIAEIPSSGGDSAYVIVEVQLGRSRSQCSCS